MRILSMNVNRMRYCNNEKIIRLVKFYERNKVDVMFATEPNMKWTTKSHNIMKNKLNRLRKSLEVMVVDSKVHSTIDSD